MTQITTPSGVATTFHYFAASVITMTAGPEPEPIVTTVERVQSLTSNLGYQLHLRYVRDDVQVSATDASVGAESFRDFNRVVEATAINNAVDYCAPAATSCGGLTEDWPSVTYAHTDNPTTFHMTSVTATDALSRSVRVDLDSTSRIDRIKRAEAGNEDINISYTNNRVSIVDTGAVVTNYSYVTNGSGQVTQTTIDPALGGNIIIDINAAFGLASAVTNGTGDTTSYTYDSLGRIERTTAPEGNYVEYDYDSRGNVTETREVAKPGSGEADIMTSATYPGSCSNRVTCNLPITTTDARGNVTNYVWNGSHGGPVSVTSPAPSSGTARPQTRYTYANQYARYRNASGTIVNAATPVTRVTRVESCATGSSCNASADESERILTYGACGSGATNLQLATQESHGGN